ncbi:ribosomal protein S12 methylthiotransferase RimO [Propionibacterium cyclohexanicum]|uniref:Ribosomal protein uS12 methylthiotransferase RimO n=1 Tax=Propionibacterium cyclohexanicum TaxID=64702 RepID=A0A1H9QS84_9ACTN|nr:30S ribosomal protein S12 methylthiotransferase RimO [Propionibacterium cyclohexanicum]SER63237.1 ribosomal protein S12 methylthiotransferase RimO [Propionibacterium cyclohexanicum]
MTKTAVHLVSLGCARNDVDSEELAARLEAGGFTLVDDAQAADAVMVNTCGFVAQAKKDSIDTILAAADPDTGGHHRPVVAVGCLAERYGAELAAELPEATVLGFDSYPQIAHRLREILEGHPPAPHIPRDRRAGLPIAPVDRHAVRLPVPGHQGDLPEGIAPASGPRVLRHRLNQAPWAPLKIASGCDRRCAFCAIPSFRGAYLSRLGSEILTEARWLAQQGVREVLLVSENSSSYGKDLGQLRALENLLGELSGVDGLEWIRVSYLQPAEMRSSLIDVMCGTEKVIPYFDLSFQHASRALLRSMRRFGDEDSFLELIAQIRSRAPRAGIRSNVIVGFPGETEHDLGVLESFLGRAGLDAIGVFGYSDEDGTAAAELPGHIDEDDIAVRVERISALAAELCDQRAAERVGEDTTALVETIDEQGIWGRASHQGPDVDGATQLVCPAGEASRQVAVGDIVAAHVISSQGVDLTAEITDRSAHEGASRV